MLSHCHAAAWTIQGWDAWGARSLPHHSLPLFTNWPALTRWARLATGTDWQRKLIPQSELARDGAISLIQSELIAQYGDSVCNVTSGCDATYGRCLNISALPIDFYDQNGMCSCLAPYASHTVNSLPMSRVLTDRCYTACALQELARATPSPRRECSQRGLQYMDERSHCALLVQKLIPWQVSGLHVAAEGASPSALEGGAVSV